MLGIRQFTGLVINDGHKAPHAEFPVYHALIPLDAALFCCMKADKLHQVIEEDVLYPSQVGSLFFPLQCFRRRPAERAMLLCTAF